MTYLVLDLETSTKTSYKRKANPFDPDNWIVMAGWQHKDVPTPIGRRYASRGEAKSDAFLATKLRNFKPTLLVGQNIKFDILHSMAQHTDNREAWMEYVANGGNIWDCQLAEYLLDGQAQPSHMLSMDDMAQRYGLDMKVDEVKALWEAGVATEDIDPDLLSRYLLGEDLVDPITREPTGHRREGDIGNTRAIFLKQLERARKSGQVKSILVNMGSLIATTEMEWNGMAANKEKGLAIAAQLEKDIASASERMAAYLPKDLPFEFNWSSRHQLSPLIFGGKVRYDRRQFDLKDGTATWISPGAGREGLYAYAQKDEQHWLLNDGTTTTVSPSGAENPFEYATYKGGKNAGEFKTKKVKVDDFDKPKSRMAECYWVFDGFTEPADEWASETEGLYSVAAEVIEALGNRDIPLLKDLADFKKMEKDLGTYFIKYDEKKGTHVGMLTLIQPDGLIHPSINHTSTVTARLSASNPNLTNIPQGNKSEVKTVFESRFTFNYVSEALARQGLLQTHEQVQAMREFCAAGGHIGQSDFSSLEIYIQAILTHCANLIQDLKDGIDLHCMRLALKEHMEYGEVFALCKGDKFDQAWDYKRTKAKITSFQRAYGAGAKKISTSTGMPIEEIEAFIKAEQERYPEIDKYCDARIEEVKRNRRPTNRNVPHPQLKAVMCQLGVSRLSTPDNKLYTYMESPSPEWLARRGTFSSFSPTEIKNYEFQGGGAEWMKVALWLAVRAFYARRNFEGWALLVNVVHDAAYIDSHAHYTMKAMALVQACMEAASDFIEYYFGWKLPLPVPAEAVYGASMAEENPFTDPAFKVLVSEERAALRINYMEGFTPSYLKDNQ